MPVLNLETKSKEQALVKTYLEENVSEMLAEKINDGVSVEKDGKKLVNKKTLDSFMKYASEEARKLASKGATSACVEDSVVYGWAVHYFEEESIIGTLYNTDGTEYKAPMPEKKTSAASFSSPLLSPPPKPRNPPQMSFFDLFTNPQTAPLAVQQQAEAQDEEPDEEELSEANELSEAEKTWLDENIYADPDGVIHDRFEPITEKENAVEPDEGPDIDTSAFDADALCKLYDDFGDEIEVR